MNTIRTEINNDTNMTTNIVFSTSYFPSVAMTAAMVQNANNGQLLIEQNETFPKQTHRNRTVIVTANGPMTLSVPVVRTNGNHTLTKEMTISYAEKWNIIHWRAIESAYNSSPYFLYYRDEVEKILMQRHELLLELNEAILLFLAKKLKQKWEIIYTEDFLREGEYRYDFRDRYSYKHPESLPSLEKYHQVFDDRMAFNPNVSILDLLFNLGPETADYLLRQKL